MIPHFPLHVCLSVDFEERKNYSVEKIQSVPYKTNSNISETIVVKFEHNVLLGIGFMQHSVV